MTEPVRPDPRDFSSPESYEKAMNDYLTSIGADPDAPPINGAMAAFQQWREDPPKDGWE